jgi:thiamine transporter ThiT
MLSIVGIFVMIFVAARVFQTANNTGRNGALWAMATVCIGLGFQFFIPVLIGGVWGLVYVLQGWPMETFQQDVMGLAIIISIICLILSFVGMFIVLKHVSKLLPDNHDTPPPPPRFDG